MNTIANQPTINKRPFVSFKFFSKAKLFLNLASFLVVMFIGGNVIGQTTILVQNFGTTSTFPSGWSGTNSWAGSTSSASSGYNGASGGGKAVFGNTGSNNLVGLLSYNNSLSTIGYTNISVIWGAKSGNTFTQPVTFEWSANGTVWSSVTFTNVTSNSTWSLVNGGSSIALPSGASGISNLRFRWSITVNNNSTYNFDDFKVLGTTTPSAPNISGVTPNNTQLSVAFTAPTSNGGASITNYKYTTDGTTWVTPSPAVTSSPLDITGLTPATTYNVQLKAVNSVGDGTASTAVSATTTTNPYTWTGATDSDWATASNWNPNGVPDGTINMTIPSNVSNSPVLSSLTVASGKTLTLQAGAKLTMSGNLTNDGTVNIGNGATIVQTGSGSNAGSGSYSMKQAISGGTTRIYYMGSPLTSATSGVFTPTSSGGNLMYTYDASQTTPVWTQVIVNSTALEIGKGYVVKMTANDTLNFTGTSINNGSIDIPCYRQASGSYLGFNLVSNPYPSYLDWDDVYAGNSATNFQSTIWYRLANSSNNMVFDTYNAPAGTGTNTNGIGAASRYIAPMQAFWVNIPSGGASSTNLSLTNAMREHYVSGVVGLRSTAQDFPAFLRLNMIQGNNLDQLIIFAKPEASENFESYDSEKMFLTGVPQFYSTVGSKNLVINGIKNNHRKSAVPLTMVLPNAGMFVFEAEELHIENGAIILEDRLENTFQDLTLNETYSFQSAAGTISDRFVIHFHLLSPEFVTDDFEVNELSASISDVSSETSEIHVLSNGKGQISVSLPENEMSDAILEVIDASGRTILKKNLIEKESIINLDNCSGIYYVRVASAQNIEFQKIFVQP